MGLPYSDFVLNIQPDDYQQLNDKIQFFLDNPARLRHMQVLRLLSPFSSSMAFAARLKLPWEITGRRKARIFEVSILAKAS